MTKHHFGHLSPKDSYLEILARIQDGKVKVIPPPKGYKPPKKHRKRKR